MIILGKSEVFVRNLLGDEYFFNYSLKIRPKEFPYYLEESDEFNNQLSTLGMPVKDIFDVIELTLIGITKQTDDYMLF